MPGAHVFLDVNKRNSNRSIASLISPDLQGHCPFQVDDLQDIGDLESYVRASRVVLFFLSKHYFSSRNCLREVHASLEEEFAKL